ncbi:MAG: hypothetical protein NVS1B6_16680 [Steroidobacteraceae bacterium]
MKRQWQIRRTALTAADGQQRWDRAYQQVLIWTSPAPPTLVVTTSGAQEAEGKHARSDVCASINAAAGTDADD